MIRLCVSGTDFCSGCNPCEACQHAIKTRVLPHAMIAGGFNQDPAQAKAFLEAYMGAFRQLQAQILAVMQQTLASKQPPATAATEMPLGTGAGSSGEVSGPSRDEGMGSDARVRVDEAGAAGGPTTEGRLVLHTATAPGSAVDYVPKDSPLLGIEPLSNDDTTSTIEELTQPETAQAVVIIPPPIVEGLTGSESADEAPPSDTVIKQARKERRLKRGLPRSLRRA